MAVAHELSPFWVSVAALDVLTGDLDLRERASPEIAVGRARSMRTCNAHLEPMDLEQAVGRLVHLAMIGRSYTVHLCNAYTLSITSRDLDFARTIDDGNLNLTDGMPLAWLGRRVGFDVDPNRRPRGSELFAGTVVAGQDVGLRHYLYGATPGVVEALAVRLRKLAPDAEIVGIESPPFRPLEPSEKLELIARINTSGAQIVWVGLGTPKQDVFIEEFRDDVNATLVAVGAAFDFIAGIKTEAPRWIRRSGFEWAYRLAREPRRLWKRYLIGNTRFIAGAIRTGANVAR